MNNYQKVFKNTLYLTISEIILKIIGVLWVLYLARSLPVSLYGRYNFVNAFLSIFSFLPDLGLGLIVIREIAKKKEKANILLGNAIFLTTILSTLTVFLILLFTFFFHTSKEANQLIFLASCTLFLSTFRSVAIFYFDGIEKMSFSAALNTLNTILLIVGAFVGFNLGLGLFGIFLGMLIGTVISFFTTWAVLLKKFIRPKLAVNIDLTKHLFIEGLPLGVAALAFMIYIKIDSIILGKLISEEAVGIYNSATPFVFSLIQLLNVPFTVALYPALTRLSKEDNKRFINAIKKSLGIIAMWSIPAAVFISFTAQLLIPFIFGQKYDEAIPVLKILIFFVPFASLSALLYKVLIIINKQKTYLFVSIFGAIINIAFNTLLIPSFSIFGAAVSSVMTQVVLFSIYTVIVFYYLKKRNTV